MKHIFSKPIDFDDEKGIKEIEIDLDSLTGNDISAAKKTFTAEGNFAPILAMDTDFCICLAARVTKRPIEFFKDLPANDYCKIAQGVSNFLSI